MIQPRLTCPSVWYKRLLLSRTHVEESYSHALRRWAGYQRFLLQADEGKSIEPFLRMLEALITDAEERADAIDNVVQAVGDSEAGVLRRIGQYESLYFKPRRDRLLKRASTLKKPVSPDNQDKTSGNRDQISHLPRTESQLKENADRSTPKDTMASTQPAEEVKDAWIRLLQERTRYLAESLTEFAALLNANQGNRDQDYYEKLFDACALETAREELQPLWMEDLNHHLHLLQNPEEVKTVVTDPACEPKKAPTKKKQPPREKVSPIPGSATETLYQPRIEPHNRKWRSTDPTANRKPAPLNTLTVLPVIKKFGTRWSDMGTSSAPMTPRSRLDLVRKYIRRGGSQRSLDGPEHDKSSIEAADSQCDQPKELGSNKLVNTLSDTQKSNSAFSAPESSITTLPSISEGHNCPGTIIQTSGFYQIAASYSKDISLASCQRGKSHMRLSKLTPNHSGSMFGSKLPPIRRRVSKNSAEQQTLPIQKPCPFNSDNNLQRKNKYR